jgi:glycosyltransferase involved in cell wall biosynthesis
MQTCRLFQPHPQPETARFGFTRFGFVPMLEHHLFNDVPAWRRQFRPTVLAGFSYRYDAELVPDLLLNIAPAIDGWVAFDDRGATEGFSSEPRRRRLLIERARELGATWVLGIDPDERIERGAATRIRDLTRERQRIVWEFNLREMFTPTAYRVDGVWGAKMQGRLFPVFDGPLCSERPLHGAWCAPPPSYSILPAGLNIYHLKMMSKSRRQARHDLYRHLDPTNRFQPAGYEYLVDEQGAELEQIPAGRDFIPHYDPAMDARLHMAEPASKPSGPAVARECEPQRANPMLAHQPAGTTVVSQMGQLRVSYGGRAVRDSKLAVVIIGLRAPKSLFDAVSSLMAQDAAAEIIVVNSGGGDAAAALAEHLHQVTLVEISEPVFVGAARNLGIHVSRAPFVAFLAADCIAAPGWVAERLKAHTDGQTAVGSLVQNDRPGNPFAWAAHLMTYGHRMAIGDGRAYGASYDRALFHRYGYFSETMMIGEDSEFHSRFDQSDYVTLQPDVRTIHRNPSGPLSFLADQWKRGTRARLMADFLRADFTVRYAIAAAVARVYRSIRSSATCLRGRERLAAMMSWPILPIGALAYLAGMVASYLKIIAAERRWRQAVAATRSGQHVVAMRLLTSAIALRPVTPRYHLDLAALLDREGKVDQAARELYASWDVERGSLPELYRGLAHPLTAADSVARAAIRLQIVLLFDRSEIELAEFLNAVDAQAARVERIDVLIVGATDRRLGAAPRRRLGESYGHFAKFASIEDARAAICGVEADPRSPDTSLVLVSSCSILPPSDWVSVLSALVLTYPEVDVFHGSCWPMQREPGGFLQSLCLDLGLFADAANNGGAFRFSRVANWACRKWPLGDGAPLVDDRGRLLASGTLINLIARAGGSSLYAPDWQMLFRVDTTLAEVLRSAYWDGYGSATHMLLTQGRDTKTQIPAGAGADGLRSTAWRFAQTNYRRWRHAKQNPLLRPPAFLLLLVAGASRQVGWLMGRRQRDKQISSDRMS